MNFLLMTPPLQYKYIFELLKKQLVLFLPLLQSFYTLPSKCYTVWN